MCDCEKNVNHPAPVMSKTALAAAIMGIQNNHKSYEDNICEAFKPYPPLGTDAEVKNLEGWRAWIAPCTRAWKQGSLRIMVDFYQKDLAEGVVRQDPTKFDGFIEQFVIKGYPAYLGYDFDWEDGEVVKARK